MKRIILLAIVATTSVSCKKERCYQCYTQGSGTPRNFVVISKKKEQYVRFYAANGYALTSSKRNRVYKTFHLTNFSVFG